MSLNQEVAVGGTTVLSVQKKNARVTAWVPVQTQALGGGEVVSANVAGRGYGPSPKARPYSSYNIKDDPSLTAVNEGRTFCFSSGFCFPSIILGKASIKVLTPSSITFSVK